MANEMTRRAVNTDRHGVCDTAPPGLAVAEPTAFAFPWAERFPILERYGALLGRILIAQIFLLSGAMKFIDWNGAAAAMQKQSMPMIDLLLPAAAIVELVCGLSIFLGFRSRVGAFVLFLYLIPTTLIFHAFWNYEGELRSMQMINFLKNIAIMGGLWFVVTFGSGMCSLDGWQRKPVRRSA
jgi:putative oxidoreductase